MVPVADSHATRRPSANGATRRTRNDLATSVPGRVRALRFLPIPSHWLSWRIGIVLVAARERVRVANVLAGDRAEERLEHADQGNHTPSQSGGAISSDVEANGIPGPTRGDWPPLGRCCCTTRASQLSDGSVDVLAADDAEEARERAPHAGIFS